MMLAHRTGRGPNLLGATLRGASLLGAGLLVLPAAARAEGMPQLDFSTPLTISQVVWGAIIFVVLYILLSRTGLPLVASVLDERATKIAKDLDEARAAKASADTGMTEAEQATAKARAESQAAINAALEEAKTAAAAQRQVATETAATVVTRLTGVAPDPNRLDGAIGSALAARGVG
jgi:F-type H+-transporting ATPase subunit b